MPPMKRRLACITGGCDAAATAARASGVTDRGQRKPRACQGFHCDRVAYQWYCTLPYTYAPMKPNGELEEYGNAPFWSSVAGTFFG